MPQPHIEVGAIVLRPWRADDADDLTAAYADPAIQKWHARSMSDGEAAAWIASWRGRWAEESGAGWAIEGGDGLLGQIALRRIHLDDGLAEVSYWVLPAARGRGVAVRALTGLTAWALGDLGLQRVELEHSTANTASCRVAERGGFAAEGVKRGSALHADGFHDMHLHARLAGDGGNSVAGGVTAS